MTTSTEPDILYHYTSQKGLLGILQTKKLWMTNILYLNDSSEYRHTIDLLKSEIEKRKKLLPPLKFEGLLSSKITPEDNINNRKHHILDILKMFCETLIDSSGKDTFPQRYVFSFSQKGNDLNQWRSYCPKEGGFSIGFDYQRLLSILRKSKG